MLAKRGFGEFFGEEHSKLSGLNHMAFAGFGL
jgi:hypothetical protein